MALVAKSQDGPLESWFRIMAGAPIFHRLVGWDLDRCPKNYRYEKLGDETEESLRLLARSFGEHY